MRTYTVQPVVGAHGKEFQVVNDLGGLVGYYPSKRAAKAVAATRNKDNDALAAHRSHCALRYRGDSCTCSESIKAGEQP